MRAYNYSNSIHVGRSLLELFNVRIHDDSFAGGGCGMDESNKEKKTSEKQGEMTVGLLDCKGVP